jgi:hypothetical protein
MSDYRLCHGIEDEDGGFLSSPVSSIDYGPEFSDALESLSNHVAASGNILNKIDGGLYKHIPGVEGVFEEVDANQQHILRIWLIKALTS